jgi:hypothetical protein
MAVTNGNADAHDPGEDLSKRNYIRWDSKGVEEKPTNEDEDIQKVAEQINTIQKAQYNVHRHCYSGLRWLLS